MIYPISLEGSYFVHPINVMEYVTNIFGKERVKSSGDVIFLRFEVRIGVKIIRKVLHSLPIHIASLFPCPVIENLF